MRFHWFVLVCVGVACEAKDSTSSGNAGGGGDQTTTLSAGQGAQPGGGSATGGTGSVTSGTGGAMGLADFAARCAAPGVQVCEGFDDDAVFSPAIYPDRGIYPAYDDVFRGTRDTNVKASGASALRFEIPGRTGANMGGQWHEVFGPFGEESEFYVQFRQRLSPEMLSIDWIGLMGTYWKQAIFHHDWTSCASVAVVTVNIYSTGMPILYTDCGARSFFTNDGIPPYLLQQGDYNCPYGNVDPVNCYMYRAEEWTTFYYRVAVGHWNAPDSHVQAWVAAPGEGYKRYVDMPGFTLYPNNDVPGPNDTFNALTLSPYMTAKDESVDHVTAYTWYDELIVSSEPIAAPQ
jgi:hypothetical protein